jgi:hypothetical protein
MTSQEAKAALLSIHSKATSVKRGKNGMFRVYTFADQSMDYRKVVWLYELDENGVLLFAGEAR